MKDKIIRGKVRDTINKTLRQSDCIESWKNRQVNTVTYLFPISEIDYDVIVSNLIFDSEVLSGGVIDVLESKLHIDVSRAVVRDLLEREECEVMRTWCVPKDAATIRNARHELREEYVMVEIDFKYEYTLENGVTSE